MTKKGTKKGIIILIIVIVVAALAGGGLLLYNHLNASSSTVAVTSVSELMDLGYTGLNNRYSGTVEAKNTVAVNPTEGLTVEECYVKAGDTVAEGDPLFRYDVDELTLSYEQLLIDITGLENTITADTEELASLDKKIAKAKESKVYDLKVKRSTVELDKKKAEYSLKDKQESAAKQKDAIDNAVVYSPCSGRIKSVSSTSSDTSSLYSDSSSSSTDYITIISGSDYCVKGTVSEQTVYSLQTGTTVLIRSRTDESDVRTGTIYEVDTDKPVSSSSSSYYYDSSSSSDSASKYAFYVSVDDPSGLMIGQHVYIELSGGSTASSNITLPSYYLVEDGSGYYVYAANSEGKIEKRTVTVGSYDEDSGCYEILSGLKLTDRLAYPDDTVTVGASVE